MENVCRVEGCNKPVRVAVRQLCSNHYITLIRSQNVPLLVNRPVVLCSVVGCLRKNYQHGVCRLHFMRLTNTGTTELLPRLPKQPEPCSAGCGRPAIAVGLCAAHHARTRLQGSAGAPDIRKYKPGGIPGYATARKRLMAIRGRVTEYTCVDCTKTATGWTLLPEARVYRETEGQYKGLSYSLEVWQYEPRCQRHKREHNDQHGHGRSQV